MVVKGREGMVGERVDVVVVVVMAGCVDVGGSVVDDVSVATPEPKMAVSVVVSGAVAVEVIGRTAAPAPLSAQTNTNS